MPSLLLVVFLVELATHLVNTIGAAAINNMLWTLLNHLPIESSKAATQHRALQSEYLKVRRELNATSSQDEFARWAKLRRTHDKLYEKLEKSKSSMEATRSRFDTYINAARLLCTRAPQWLLPFWFSRRAMFWLPYGWFPYYAEWLLSFPRAPMGSVSVASWQVACTIVIGIASQMVISIVGLVVRPKAQAMPVPAQPKGSTAGEKDTKTATKGAAKESSKEL